MTTRTRPGLLAPTEICLYLYLFYVQLVELVNLTAGYLRSVVTALEETERELRTADVSSGCTYHTSCECCGCEELEAWSGPDTPNLITLHHTTTTPYPTPTASPPNIDVCLSETLGVQFQHVAAKESDAARVGYEYYGSQQGTYMQWPGIQWCPEAYDPRFVRVPPPRRPPTRARIA